VNDPQLNQLLDKQRGQLNEAERKGTIKEIQMLLAEQQYQIYYSTDTRTYFWDPSVANYRPSGFFPYTHVMKTWRDR
jgi:ABC-type transport system substrate-binding protein